MDPHRFLAWPNWHVCWYIYPASYCHISLFGPCTPCLASSAPTLCEHSGNMSSNKIWIYDEIPLKLLRNTHAHRGDPIFARGEIKKKKKTWEWKGQDFGANNKFSGLKQKDADQRQQKSRSCSRSSSCERTEWQNTRNNVIWCWIPTSGPPDKYERQQLGNNFVWLWVPDISVSEYRCDDTDTPTRTRIHIQ